MSGNEDVKDTNEDVKDTNESNNSFENEEDMSIFKEFTIFLMENKLWWMIPIAIVLGLLIAIMIFGAQAGSAAPFIYTLF